MFAAVIIASAVAAAVLPTMGLGGRLRMWDLSYWMPTLTIWSASLCTMALNLWSHEAPPYTRSMHRFFRFLEPRLLSHLSDADCRSERSVCDGVAATSATFTLARE